MPLLNSITTPYAEAFLQVSDAKGETTQVVDQAREVLSLWRQSPELRAAMGSPVLEIDGKKAALVSLFGDQLSPSFLNLLKLLAVACSRRCTYPLCLPADDGADGAGAAPAPAAGAPADGAKAS